jgi:hypothetical protein
VQAHIEASEQCEAAAWARADAAEQHAEAAGQRAQALEGQVLTVVETNAQLQEEQQSQLDELSSSRQIQMWENNLINKWLKFIGCIHSGASQSSSYLSSIPITESIVWDLK